MDHVNNPQMDDGPGYPDDMGDFALDPNLIDHANWSMPSEQYQSQSQDPFVSQPSFQPYSTSSFTYGEYGVPQQPQYSGGPYASIYSSQAPQSTTAQPYGQSQYGYPQFQSQPAAQNTFQNGHFAYPNSGAEGRTISPAALQRDESLQGQQNSNVPTGFSHLAANRTYPASPQAWSQGVSYCEGSQTTSAPSYNAQNQLHHGQVPLNHIENSTSKSSNLAKIAPTQSFNNPAKSASQAGLAKLSNALRITHAELLSKLGTSPSNGNKYAPFMFLEDQSIELNIPGKLDVPKYKVRKNRSGKPLVPGLDLSATLDSPSLTSVPKSRSKKTKTTESLKTKALKRAQETKSRIGNTPNAGSVASPSLASSSDDEDQTSTEEDSDEGSDEDMPVELMNDVRPGPRPLNPVEAAAWDAIGIVWADRHRHASREEIIKAIPEFQEFISTLREDLKKIAADLAKAEGGKNVEEVKRLKEKRTTKRQTIAMALDAANKTGHHHILERLGDSQKLVNILTSILIDCTKMEDYTGDLPKSVLRLMTRFTTLKEPLLQKVKFDKIGKIFSKKGDADIKADVTKILNSTPEAKERAKKAEEDARKAEIEARREAIKLEKLKNGLALQEKLRAQKKEEAAKSSGGLKRSHDGDGSNGKPVKKVASDATSVVSSQKVTATPIKAIAPSARPSNFFANLARPGPKPQTAAKQFTNVDKKQDSKAEAAPVPQSSLAAILASIEKPKEISKVPEAPEAPPRPPETAEEKAKRERKESRRHLRVRWRDGAALEEIRLFKHEQAEDEGRQDDMLRDAHDDRSEGLRLKQALEVSDTLDDDEEATAEIANRPYPELIRIDFGTLDDEARAKNFVTRGGNVTFKTPQQQIQEQRESLELMVVYTDPNDVPSTPREPYLRDSAPPVEEKAFGNPREPWLQQRLREIWQFGTENAMSVFVRMLEDSRRHLIPEHARQYLPPTTTPNSQTSNVTAYLNQIKEIPQGHISQQPQSSGHRISMDPAALANLQSIVAKLKGKPYPPVEPPEWMTEKGKQEWWVGYHRDEAKKRVNVQPANAIQPQMATFSTPSRTQAPQMQAPQMALPQFPGYAMPQAGSAQPNAVAPEFDITQLNKIIANLNGQPAQPTAQPQQQQFGWNGQWPTIAYQGYDAQAQAQQYQQQPHWDNPHNDPSHAGYGNPKQEKSQQRSWETNHDNGNDRTRARKEVPEGVKAYKYKTKPCKFWSEGKCAKGAACGYLHDEV